MLFTPSRIGGMMGAMTKKTATRPEFSRICALLPELTPEELAELRLRAKFLGGSTAPPVAPEKPRDRSEADWLLRGIEDELRRRGVTGSGRLPVDRIAPGWSKTSAGVRADLRSHVERGGAHWRHPWAALGRVAARTLADYLARGRVKVTPRTMLLNADKIMAALDDQFPGYVESGMLHCCLDPKLVGSE